MICSENSQTVVLVLSKIITALLFNCKKTHWNKWYIILLYSTAAVLRFMGQCVGFIKRYIHANKRCFKRKSNTFYNKLLSLWLCVWVRDDKTFTQTLSCVLNWWMGKLSGSIACTRKQQPRFYWSCSSVVMNDATICREISKA